MLIGIIGSSGEEPKTQSEDTNSNSNEKDNEVITFLPCSNGKDFFTILCDVIEADTSKCNVSKGANVGDSTLYTYGNAEYSFDVETNSKNEVNYVEMLVYSGDDYKNFFLAISRFEYNSADKQKAFNWINDNLGKEATTKIGDANFKLSLTTTKKPVLEVYSDGNENYQKEQLNKVSDSN